jgi:glycerol 2-dehydrogenase (NADP+)
MHWPVPTPPTEENYPLLPNGDRHVLHEDEWSYIDTWKEMEKLLKEGKCKAIGVSNVSIPFMERILAECEVVPAVNQVTSLEFRLIQIECHPLFPQEELVRYCQDKGIVVQAYSPLGSVDSPLHLDLDIQGIATNHNASTGQVMLSWLGILPTSMEKLTASGTRYSCPPQINHPFPNQREF